MTLACEDANSKLVEVVNVANGDDEDRVRNSLLYTWELRLGNKAKLLFRLSAQGLAKDWWRITMMPKKMMGKF